MKNKKLISLTAAAAVITTLFTGCGGSTSNEQTAAAQQETTAANTQNVTEAETDAPDAIETTSAENAAEETKTPAGTAPDTKSMNALEFSKLLGNGIDLGNTHEAYGHTSYPADTDPKVFEKLWGQPETTQEIISGMKAAGFDTVRVPVAWTNCMDYESGDYTISAAMLDRIGEVIDYAVNADMYVIVNDHWDGSWWGMFGSADEKTRADAMEMYISMWTQIAEKYKDYPDNLIFESANEELGDRLNDTDVAKDSGTLSKAQCFETANKINQTFVDTVRGTGSNNTDRFLLIAGYNTDIENTCNPAFKMPTDTAKDKLLLSVHYYTPADYCLNGSVSHWGNERQYNEMNTLLEKLTKFTDEGYGVIIGEYGVLGSGSEPREDWDLWFNNFLDNCDLYNYVPVLWDCNGLYNKSSCTIPNADVAALFTERSNAAREGMSYEDIQTAARTNMDAALKAASEKTTDLGDVPAPSDDTAVAWIMYTSADWGISYSVGDVYDPTSMTDGTVAVNPVITGAGEYTASLDFTNAGKPKGTQFAALGVSNCEQLFPGAILDIKKIEINGEEVELAGKPYTTSDDGKCTRVNLYNQWVGNVPADVRSAGGEGEFSAKILQIADSKPVNTISVTFEVILP